MMAKLMEEDLKGKYLMEPGVEFCTKDYEQMYIDNCWKANLSVTGAGGLPNY